MSSSKETPFELIEANLTRLASRMSDVPICSILLTRIIMHVAREIAARFEQQLRPHDLTETEFRVLTTLFSQPDGTAHPGDLCLRTSQSAANMSRICDALVARDLITRVLSARDRRRMVLRITQPGEFLLRSLLPGMFANLHETMKGFEESELRELTRQLKGLGAAFERSHIGEAAESTP